jgi:hypothetical protein
MVVNPYDIGTRISIAGILCDTVRYCVDKKHLTYLGTFPVDISSMRVESIFRKIATDNGASGIYHPLWYSQMFLKAILRARCMAKSDYYEYFIDQPMELRKLVSNSWRFTPGMDRYDSYNYDAIENYWLDNFSERDISKITNFTNIFYKNIIESQPYYNKQLNNSVLLFNMDGININIFSLGDIRTYRFTELQEEVLKRPKINPCYDNTRPTLDIWEGVVVDDS